MRMASDWPSRSSFGNILVYGDYDTDGISATVLAMEIFRHKASGVRYFIPRRDVHGYGLHPPVLEQVVRGGCNTLVVVDCGTNDSELLAGLKERGVEVFVFDHHTVAERPAFPTIVNPCANGGENIKNTAKQMVFWQGIYCLTWLMKLLPKNFFVFQ